MRPTGIGLKPLIAIYLLLVLGLAAALIGYASARLLRHALVLENVRWGRAVLAEAASAISGACPELAERRPCPALPAWLRARQAWMPAVQNLSVYDAEGRLLQSTDAELGAKALWEGFEGRAEGSGTEADWSIGEIQGRRLLWVQEGSPGAGWVWRLSLSMDQIDRTAAHAWRSIGFYCALVAFVLALAGWFLMFRLVVKPTERLLAAVDRISEGELNFLLGADRGSEFGRLSSSLSRMARRLDSDQHRLKEQIAQLERLNRELSQAQQGLIRSEKLASVGRLAAGLAHEVGNPLSAILGYVELLQTGDIPVAERADVLARVEKEVERVDRIIRDLLAYSRPGKGETTIITPARLFEESLALLRPQKKFKQVTVAVEVSGQLPVVSADFDQLRQILVNLLFNALDAVAEGGHLWLRAVGLQRGADGALGWLGHPGEPPFFALGDLHAIRPPRSGAGLPADRPVVVFSVTDDGHGIAPGDLGKVFDPFFTTKEPGRGTGLGLAICHSTVTALGGEIWVFSQPGRGTQLAFTIPAAAGPGGPF